ncbi:hypothetical protein Guyu_036 [Pseudomonas phage Guyu]|uniref:Uncharacterized protein n=2 Tax=Septimatrevirus TaxID=1921544 RepID=A0AAE9BLE1_9CAUD|nr:hypothetical protein PM392_gp08 [Pseudomonas phage Kaya]YP_010597483.1 hypothetical protein PM394_gp36 [Pseudomonas phage Guyu]UAG58546.1 hypothetical protein Kaya_008 [Pseudomonas phage Kaya]UAG58631.1 hypothetical protein Guyu_036 [Pseudomonas phage Guyu]
MKMTLDEAKKKARENRCFIVTKPEYFLLYRESTPKNVCVGKRKDEKGIIALVKKACATA